MDDYSPVHLETDASDYGIGAYLYQIKEDPGTEVLKQWPIAFTSKALNGAQLNCATIEKEAFAIYIPH